MKIEKVAAGKNHILALSDATRPRVYSWGRGSRGQLGHGDYEDQRYPRVVESLAADVRDLMAVGHTSVAIDEFNNIHTFGCNKQGQLGDNSEEECRNLPGKLGREFLLDQIVMLRGHYEEAAPLTDRDLSLPVG